jgi:formylglycine-generating enzyme required for sulfatase activity/predicted Ser/Thr protein kinase
MSQPAPTNSPRWDGTEATSCDLPRLDGAEHSPDSERWDGTERTTCGSEPGTARGSAPSSSRGEPKAAPPVDDGWHRQGGKGPLTGQVFADYEIGTVLGEGGMGTVYRARQISLGRRVAVKTLSSAVGNEPLQRARFEIEARAASLIQSPHVVAVFAAGSWDGTAYFVMEYVEGSDLGSLIEANAGHGLGHQRAMELVTQAARGLSAAAAKGIVHRDIKPGNLLLTAHGMLKIADFGISKIAGDHNLTRTGTAVGTPSYLSPEQGRGEPTDIRSDIYSLGCVFYEILTDRKPFISDNADAVIYQHNYAEPTLPRALDPGIPEPVQAVVVRCLQKDPAKRYPTPDDLIHDLDAIRAGDVSVTALLQARYGTGAEEQMRRRLGRRNRWAMPLVAALVLASLAGGTVVWRQSTAESRAQDQRNEEQLRLRLRDTLDRIQPPPPGSHDDVVALTRLAGAHDADVQRWRGKLESLAAIDSRLARLYGETLPDAAQRNATDADLMALAELVGPDSPAAQRAIARLQETTAEIARLRQQLAELDGQSDTTIAIRERLAPGLASLARLVGEGDADLARWRRRIAALDSRLTTLRTGLASLDQPDATPDEQALDRASEALEELARRRGATPADAEELRWRAALASQRAAIARLRDRLGRLDEGTQPNATLLGQLEADLAAYRLRVLPDEALRLRWEGRVESARRRMDDLQKRCALLEQANELTVPQLDDARNALHELRPLVATDDKDLLRYAKRLANADAALAAWRTDLAVLDAQTAIAQGAQERARTALRELALRQAVNDADVRQAGLRLEVEQRTLSELRTRCAVIDDASTRVSTALADDIALYGRLMGAGDADYKRWRARIVDFVDVRRRLTALDSPAALPDTVDADLAALARMVRTDDAMLAAWRSKVQRVRALTASLTVLDRVAPLPGDAGTALDELHELIGAFPQEPAWRAKLARVQALAAACADRLNDRNVLLANDALALLDKLIAETGMTPASTAWQARAAVLAGPATPPWASASSRDAYGNRAVLELPGDPRIAIAFRYVPPGTFTIGSPPEEIGRETDEIRVAITLSHGRWMAETEVTQAAWERVMGSNPASNRGADLPAHRLDWEQATAFCVTLSQLAGVPARLPTEAEWEHACRAGDSDPAFNRGDIATLERVAWHRTTSSDGCHPVGRRPPNALGLHDMLGNVWEWCSDRYGLYPATGATDPHGGEQDKRVVRGGCWADPAPLLRVANRAALDPDTRSSQVGLRVLIEAE